MNASLLARSSTFLQVKALYANKEGAATVKSERRLDLLEDPPTRSLNSQ